jgi:hypothetical protein
MDRKSRAAQCLVEHQIIQHVKAALRITLGWEVDSVGLARKLSSVHFTMQSLFRHLQRLMQIEEEDGYLAFVREEKPHLTEKAAALGRDHEQFRDAMRRLDEAFARLGADDRPGFDAACAAINELLARLDAHDQGEMELVQAAFWEDEGGEG